MICKEMKEDFKRIRRVIDGGRKEGDNSRNVALGFFIMRVIMMRLFLLMEV